MFLNISLYLQDYFSLYVIQIELLKKHAVMKKITILWLSALLMMVVGLSSCSSDDESCNEEFCEPDNISPEFADGIGQNPRYETQTTTSAFGIDIKKDAYGGIRWISFGEKSFPLSFFKGYNMSLMYALIEPS